MANGNLQTKQGSFLERLIRRALTAIGGIFDRIFGRRRRSLLPSAGDLADKLRGLLDAQAQSSADGARLAPHLIKIKYPWGQTGDEFLAALRDLENELLVVAIEHINDNRYRTLAPPRVTSKPDMFVNGFGLSVGYDEREAAGETELKISAEALGLPQKNGADTASGNAEVAVLASVKMPHQNEREARLRFAPNGTRRYGVGRTKENPLALDDTSVSKVHATLVMNANRQLMVADTGSTNGTFINGERLSYGKAYEIRPDDVVGFGSIIVRFGWEALPAPAPVEPVVADAVSANAVPVNDELTVVVDSHEANEPIAETENADLPQQPLATQKIDIANVRGKAASNDFAAPTSSLEAQQPNNDFAPLEEGAPETFVGETISIRKRD